MLDKAILIAAKAHEGQVDKGGQPYILHPLRVMFSRKTEIEKICAVLHDVIEDTDISLDYLRDQEFSEEILSALDALTRRDGETYDEYISRVVKNKTASHVKLCDLCDNMDLSRIKNPSDADYERVKKYRKAADRISYALDENEDREFINTKQVEIDGCVSVPENCSKDEFWDKFIDFIERNYWSFCGGINEIK
ncbi:Guanosine-3',5'-bis(diphosphate) 3'-pyrophosphohydrolase [Clostridium luticellarii]|uniref:Guanosine-3',5'-bis(Diphosphate) 3'-pyrophosphohydrolase n=1 Tax=Clostridium luticellarii TaxID=1691940 RepID=A0A2T0B7U6_9CLOT|nr:Guanosine-3',5'-bis(diphosphate) 3'-pyrophosphohydrolase [Clostridium luticellarii]